VKKSDCLVGFDLGGTKMLAAVLDAEHRILATCKKKTRANRGADEGVSRVIECIRTALDEAGVQASRLAGIGVGSPGPLDLNTGTILESPNLGWSNVPLKKRLEKAMGCPVVVANDVDTGTYGEYRFGAGRGARCVVGVFPGTGIGGACVYEGKLIRGRVSSCMEIGHIKVQADGELCGCGKYGCLETVASRLSVSAQAAAAAYRGYAPALLDKAGTDLSRIRSGALAASVAAGEQTVEAILRKAARWVGFAISNVVNLLAPDVVVLGGGLVEEMPDLYLEEVRAVVMDTALDALSADVRFAVAELGDNAVIMGAAALAETAGG